MSKEDPNDLQHYHDKGEQDRAHGEGYNPPNSGWPYQIDIRPHEQDQRDAYNQGWENADKQDNGSDK